jgi:hypothetical protein
MNFSITSKMTPREYAKVMFIGLYKRPVFIICAIVGLYLLTTVFLDYFGVVNYYDTQPRFELFGGVFLVLLPTLIVMISVRQFKSNPSFQNDITYTFRTTEWRCRELLLKARFRGDISSNKRK